MHVLCEDESVIGRAFYIMEFMQGRVLWDQALPGMTPAQRGEIYDELNRVIAALHTVKFADKGLAGYGKPGNYFDRQIGRWSKQYKASADGAGPLSQPIPEMERLVEWLPAHIPAAARDESKVSIVHGDYRLDNVLVDGDDRITAVLDWEMSTLGDPLTDVALLVAYAERDKVSLQMVSNASSAPGYPSTDEVVARYAERSGRDVSALNWYVSFAFFKLAVILEGIYFRYSKGQTVGAGFENVGSGVVPLIAHGNESLKEEK
jgi:aminoglycoside phosphotransferase (APT) family kinase protein